MNRLNNITKPAVGTLEWRLVTSASQLSAGDKIVIATIDTTAETKTAMGGLSETYCSPVDVSISDGVIASSTLPSDVAQFTLGGSSGSWTLTSKDGQLYSDAEKSLNYDDDGAGTWTIAIDGSSYNATITSGTSSNGRILYNSGASRYTTYYKAATSTTMMLPRIYKLSYEADPVEYANQNFNAQNAVMEFADYVNDVMNDTNVCSGTKENLGDAWEDIAAKYDGLFGDDTSLSDDDLAFAKNMFKYATAEWNEDHDENTLYILERAMATYDYCVTAHHMDHFMTDDVRVPDAASIIPSAYSVPSESPLTTTLWVVLGSGLAGLTAIGAAYWISKKRRMTAE